MTPQETTLTIEAAIWRDERAQKQALSMAWHTAALQRQKKMPGLKQLMQKAFPPKVTRRENEKRKRDFEEMTAAVDVAKVTDKLTERLKAKRKKP